MKARAVAHGRRCTNGHGRNRNRVETAPLLGASACRTTGPEPAGTVPNPGSNDRAARSRNSRPRQKADQTSDASLPRTRTARSGAWIGPMAGGRKAVAEAGEVAARSGRSAQVASIAMSWAVRLSASAAIFSLTAGQETDPFARQTGMRLTRSRCRGFAIRWPSGEE